VLILFQKHGHRFVTTLRSTKKINTKNTGVLTHVLSLVSVFFNIRKNYILFSH